MYVRNLLIFVEYFIMAFYFKKQSGFPVPFSNQKTKQNSDYLKSLKIAEHLDKKKKYKHSDLIVDYMLSLANSKFKDTEGPEDVDKYLSDLRSSFIDFLSEVVMQDFIKEHGRGNLSSESLVDYYFNNREKYEDELDNYNLMLGQTEGIMSDDEFIKELDDEHILEEDGAMKREGV